MEQDSQQPRPIFHSPSMRLWLLIALNFGCYGILILFAGFPSFSWLIPSMETSTPFVARLSVGFTNLFLFLVPSLIFANAVLPERFGFYKINRDVKPMAVVIGSFAVLASVFFIDVVAQWNASLIHDPELIAEDAKSAAFTNWILQMPEFTDLLVCLVTSAFIPAFVEEVFFRGGIQQLLGTWVKNPHTAIVVAAMFFSFLHLELSLFIVRFIIGLTLGYLFWWSGSLRISITAHFVFNAFTIINAYIAQHNPESWWAKLETTYILGAISFVVSLGALLTCRNLLVRNKA